MEFWIAVCVLWSSVGGFVGASCSEEAAVGESSDGGGANYGWCWFLDVEWLRILLISAEG